MSVSAKNLNGTCPPLMVLRLRGNNITAKGAKMLANLLKLRKYNLSNTLEELDLGHSGIGERGAADICEVSEHYYEFMRCRCLDKTN